MQSIIEFLWECFSLGRSTKAERRNAYGCMFAVIGAFALFCVAVAAAQWLFLKP